MRPQGVKRNALHGVDKSCATTKQAYQWHKWHNFRRIAYVRAHVGRNQKLVPLKTVSMLGSGTSGTTSTITLTRAHTHGTSNKSCATCATHPIGAPQ